MYRPSKLRPTKPTKTVSYESAMSIHAVFIRDITAGVTNKIYNFRSKFSNILYLV